MGFAAGGDALFSLLMGDKVEPRRALIQAHGAQLSLDQLDIYPAGLLALVRQGGAAPRARSGARRGAAAGPAGHLTLRGSAKWVACWINLECPALFFLPRLSQVHGVQLSLASWTFDAAGYRVVDRQALGSFLGYLASKDFGEA